MEIGVILQSDIMGYAQRFIIGVFLIVSAFEIYEYSPQSHNPLMYWISKMLNSAQEDGSVSNYYKQGAAILIFCSGAAIIIGYGLLLAILSQSFITLLAILDPKKTTFLNSSHWFILNFAVLIILIINHQCIDQEDFVCARQKQDQKQQNL